MAVRASFPLLLALCLVASARAFPYWGFSWSMPWNIVPWGSCCHYGDYYTDDDYNECGWPVAEGEAGAVAGSQPQLPQLPPMQFPQYPDTPIQQFPGVPFDQFPGVPFDHFPEEHPAFAPLYPLRPPTQAPAADADADADADATKPPRQRPVY